MRRFQLFFDILIFFTFMALAIAQQTPDVGSVLGDKEGFVEGVVFTHPDGRMAKLRIDMFDWYKGPRHKHLQEKANGEVQK